MLVLKTFRYYGKDDRYMMGKVKRLILPFNSRDPSFLDVLRDSTPRQQHPSVNQPLQMISIDIPEPWLNDDTDLAGHQLRDGIGDGQDMNIEDENVFGVKGLQAEANTMLDPEWTLSLDELVMTPSAEAGVGTGHFHVGILDHMAQGQVIDWEHQADASQQAGASYVQGAGPEHTEIENFMLTSLQDVTAPSQAHTNTHQCFETVDKSVLLGSLPKRIPEGTPKRASKRKRIKTALSRKKPRMTPSPNTFNRDPSSSKIDLSARSIVRTEIAKKSATHGTTLSKHARSDDPTQHPRVNHMPAWDRGPNGRDRFDNAGIVRDIEISESERRPQSWPHRNPWRKSLDISVAVLTKGFEKLRTEKGEASPPAAV